MNGWKQAAGKLGEEEAAAFLKDKGYQILERNFRTRLGEIDLIARDGETIVFAEVKTRSSDRYGDASEAVTRKKVERIHKIGELFLQQRNFHQLPFRIDVLTVNLSQAGEPPHVDQIVNITA